MGRFMAAHQDARCVFVGAGAGFASAAVHASMTTGAERDGLGLPPLVLGLYFSVLAGIAFYQLLLCLALRDPVYLHHLGLLASLGVSQLAATASGGHHFWSVLLLWQAQVQSISLGVLAWFAVLFAQRYLPPHGGGQVLRSVMRGLAVGWPFVLAGLPWADPAAAAPWLLLPVALSAASVVGAAFAARRLAQPGSTAFALAWIALMASAALGVAGASGSLPATPAWVYVQLLASGTGVVLLCLALASRLQADRARRDQSLVRSVREQVEQEVSHRASLDKSRFLVAVSHDLRQPLYALTLATESMSRQRPLRQPGPMLAQMRSALQTADGLLESLYTVARLETGALKPDVVDFSVQPLLERLDQRYAGQARTLGLRWTVTPSLARVRSDPQLLERMLANLIGNALRFTERGGVVVACRSRRAHLLLQVWDTGKGMSLDDQETLFGAHFRGIPESDTDNGVGLGLAIVKQCARLLDIGLAMRSVPGKGSCFSLWVPLAPPQVGVAADSVSAADTRRDPS